MATVEAFLHDSCEYSDMRQLAAQDDAGNSFQSYLTRYGVTNPYKQSGSTNPLYL